MGKVSLIILTCSIVFYSFVRSTQSQARPRLLVFSKTLGWHHSAIPAGIVALEKIAGIEGYLTDTTIDASYFNDDSLKQYSAVVFNNTTEPSGSSTLRLSPGKLRYAVTKTWLLCAGVFVREGTRK